MNVTTAHRAEGMTTSRTVDRHLTHRSALAEVFLTDFVRVDGDTFRAAAQLPPGHFYYGDHIGHIGHPAPHDPLAVFESVRQMLLCAMHVQHGASRDTKAITATADLEIANPQLLRAEGGPLDLALMGEVAFEKAHGTDVSRVVHEVEVLTSDARSMGRVRVDTALRHGDAYEKIRMSHRAGQPPDSNSRTLLAPPPAEPVAPYLVGREHPGNVVLGDAVSTGDAVTAGLRVPVTHASMFDHPQDHVPGPVMMEAARQATLLLAGERLGLAPTKLYLREMRASYHRFAELDSKIVVRASLLAEAGPDAARRDCAAEVILDQGGDPVARLEVRLGSALDLEHDTKQSRL